MRFARIQAGLYEANEAGRRYTIEEMGQSEMGQRKRLWHVRRNGEVFDAAETLAEAKELAEIDLGNP